MLWQVDGDDLQLDAPVVLADPGEPISFAS
jgi:hypothetical protein